MSKGTQGTVAEQAGIEGSGVWEEVLREGARRMLLQAVEAEVDEYIERHAELRDGNGHRVVVRNGHPPERELVTGIGPVPLRQPRVQDGRAGGKVTSKILPPYMRRVPSIDALIPYG